MTLRIHQSGIGGPSRRVQASNTIERSSAPLDGRSAVALEFCAFFLKKHASINVPAAVIIRRGLLLLAEYLSSLEGPEIDREAHAIRDAGTGSGSALSLTQARARIEEHLRAPGAQPMACFQDALHSVEENKAWRDAADRLEAFMAQQFPNDPVVSV